MLFALMGNRLWGRHGVIPVMNGIRRGFVSAFVLGWASLVGVQAGTVPNTWNSAHLPHAATWRRHLEAPASYAYEKRLDRYAAYDCGDFTVEAYRQANGPGTVQRTFLAVPKKASGKLPAVVVPFYFPEAMLGFNPADGGLNSPFCSPNTNLTFYAGVSFLEYLARRGYVTISAEAYHLTYAPATSPTNNWSKWRHVGENLQKDWPSWTGMGKLVADTRLLVDALCADSRVDASRIGIIGHSLGGKMAFYTGLLDPRIKAVVVSDFGFFWERSNWEAIWYWGDKLKSIQAEGLSHRDLLLGAREKPVLFLAGKYDNTPAFWEGLKTDPAFISGVRRGVGSPQHRPTREAVAAAYDFLDEQVKNRP